MDVTVSSREVLLFPFFFPGRTRWLFEHIFPKGNDLSSWLFLTAHRTRIEDFYLRACEEGRTPLILPEIATIKEFAIKTVSLHRKVHILSPIEKFLLLYRISSRTSPLPDMDLAALCENLSSLIKECKISYPLFSLDFFREAASNFHWAYPHNKELLLWAFTVMEEYQKVLSKESLADEDDLYILAADLLSKDSVGNLLIDGVLEILPHQKSFFSSLAEHSASFVVTCHKDPHVPADAADRIIQPALQFFSSLPEVTVRTIPLPVPEKEEKVVIFSSPEEEVSGIADMLQSSMDSGFASQDLLVIFPKMPYYRDIVERIFTRKNLPFRLTPGYFLHTDPSIVAIFSLFEYIESSNWRSLMALFSTSFFSFDAVETEEFSQRGRTEFEGAGFFPSRGWLRQWKNVRKLEDSGIRTFSGSHTISFFSDTLLKILHSLGWHPFRKETGVWLRTILRALEGDELITRTMYVRLLKHAINLIEIEEFTGEGIRVMGVLDSGGVEARLVWYGGATSEDLPMAPSQREFFMPDALKSQLGLSSLSLRLARERLDLYRLRSLGKAITFTLPAKVAGVPKTKSFLLYHVPESLGSFRSLVSPSSLSMFSGSPDRSRFLDCFVRDGIIELSATGLNSLIRCPYRFYLESIEGISAYILPEVEELPASWGTLIHEAFEAMNRKALQDPFYPPEDLLQIFRDQAGIRLDPRYEVKNFNFSPLVRRALLSRLERICDLLYALLLSHRFCKVVGVESSQVWRRGNFSLTMKFDRVEECGDGSLSIIDLKTGRTAPEAPATKFLESHNLFDLKDIQMLLYSLAAKDCYGRDPSMKIWLLSFQLKDSAKGEHTYKNFTRFQDLFSEQIEELGENLANEQFAFSGNKQSCFGCSFFDFCPER
jgi:hypothetical protein